MGKPVMGVFAVSSPTLDMFAIGKGMEERGWLVFADSHPLPALRYMQSPGHEPFVDAYLAASPRGRRPGPSGELTVEGGRARYT